MAPCHKQAFVGRKLKHRATRLNGVRRIDVEYDRDVRVGDLQLRNVDDIAPEQDRGTVRCELEAGVARRMAIAFQGIQAGDPIAPAKSLQPILVWLEGRPYETAGTLSDRVGTRHAFVVEPEGYFFFVRQYGGIGKSP